MDDLPQCQGTAKSTGRQCTKLVSLPGEVKCPLHGGKRKDGKTRGNSTADVSSEKATCGHPNADGKTYCKRSVKKVGEKCIKHSGKETVKPHAIDVHQAVGQPTLGFDRMNLAFIACFHESMGNKIIRDLAEWYLIGANKAKDHDLSPDEWAAWIAGGCSNANGTSFKEVHGHDAMIFLAHLPPMSLHKEFLLNKYQEIAEITTEVRLDDGKYVDRPKFGAVNYNWSVYCTKKGIK